MELGGVKDVGMMSKVHGGLGLNAEAWGGTSCQNPKTSLSPSCDVPFGSRIAPLHKPAPQPLPKKCNGAPQGEPAACLAADSASAWPGDWPG